MNTRSYDDRDPLGLADDAPLLRAYLDAADRRAAGEHPFCTPGHKGLTALTGERDGVRIAYASDAELVSLQVLASQG